MLTIFTPTYNRAHTLGRLYESLKNQTLKNFEWLIIDDGSTDQTEKIVQQFIDENILVIRYIKQRNAGKQAAWNKAVQNAKGDLFCGVDSDDALEKDRNIEQILYKYAYLLDDEAVIGLRFLAYSNVKKSFDGRKISDYVHVTSYFNEIADARNFGERIDVFKTGVLKKYLYPITLQTKFIPEIWLYVQLSHAGYRFAYIPEALRLFFDDEINNRLGRSSIAKHALGHYIARSTMLSYIPYAIFLKNPRMFLATLIRYSQCANFLKIKFLHRVRDTNLIFASCSFLLLVFNIGFK